MWQRAELFPGEELELDVLRIGVFREAWECLTDNDACSLQPMVQPLSRCEPCQRPMYCSCRLLPSSFVRVPLPCITYTLRWCHA